MHLTLHSHSHKLYRCVCAVALAFVAGVFPALAQTGVKIATSAGAADPSAMLDIESSVKGLLIPRMTTAQRVAIASPATGLMVYQTDGTPSIYYNAGTPASPNWTILSAGQLSGVGNVNYITKWTAFSPNGVLGNSIIYDNGTNVGIGTTSPVRKLEVNNAMKFTNGSTDANDGVIGTAPFAPGLNIVGINTDGGGRKVNWWGSLIQNENPIGNTLLGTTSVATLKFSADATTMTKAPRVIHTEDPVGGCPPARAAGTDLFTQTFTLTNAASVYINASIIRSYAGRADLSLYVDGAFRDGTLDYTPTTQWFDDNVHWCGVLAAGSHTVSLRGNVSNIWGCGPSWGSIDTIIFE